MTLTKSSSHDLFCFTPGPCCLNPRCQTKAAVMTESDPECSIRAALILIICRLVSVQVVSPICSSLLDSHTGLAVSLHRGNSDTVFGASPFFQVYTPAGQGTSCTLLKYPGMKIPLGKLGKITY